MESVLRYIGKKNIDINAYNITKFNNYVEAFGGSFNTGFNVMEQNTNIKAVYNDLDKNLVNFWIQLRDNCNKLFNKIIQLSIKTDADIEEYIKTLEYKLNSKDNIERAAVTYLLNRYKTLNGYRFLGINNFIEMDMNIISDMLLKVEIHNRDYKEILQMYNNEDTFILIDPPYILENNKQYYNKGTENVNLNELIDILKNLKCKWLFTYNYNENLLKALGCFNKKVVIRQFGGILYKELYIDNL